MDRRDYKYVLAGQESSTDAIDEYKRLKFQNQLPQYLISNLFKKEDFSFVKDGFEILDSGFGAACFSEFVLDSSSADNMKINAVDRLEPLLKYTISEMNESRATIFNPIVNNFLTLDDVGSASQDLAITRYTFQHVPYEMDKYARSINRVLKPGGKFFIIDGDNISSNIQTFDKEFNEQVIKVSYGLESFHPQSCPLIYRSLYEEGFVVNEKRHFLSEFTTEKHLLDERKVWEMRFKKVKSFIASILGGRKEAEIYVGKFLDAFYDKNTMFYMNQFGFIAEKAA